MNKKGLWSGLVWALLVCAPTIGASEALECSGCLSDAALLRIESPPPQPESSYDLPPLCESCLSETTVPEADQRRTFPE